MCDIQELYLDENKIGDTGLASLADACAKGALAQGASVNLSGNSATEAGKQAMRDATMDCGRSVYL